MSTIDNLKIEIFSHFFRLLNPPYYIEKLISEYMRPLVLFESVKAVGEKERYMPTKTFGSRTKDHREYHFHINQLSSLMAFFEKRGIDVDHIPITTKPLFEPTKIRSKTTIVKSPRDYQLEPIDFIIHPPDNQRTVLIGLPTGTGKTFCGLYSCVKIGTRVLMFLLPIYIDKWIKDIQENIGLDPKRIMVVQGGPSLAGLISLAEEGQLDADFIIVSLVTMRLFIESYEDNRTDCLDQFGCYPQDFCEKLGVGQVMIDEAHQHIHALFKIVLHLHVPQLQSLTATLLTDQAVIKRAHDILYPKQCRYEKLLMKKYINVTAIEYKFFNFRERKIRTTEFNRSTYSHAAYEKSLQRNKYTLNKYLELLAKNFEHHFINQRQQQDKAMFFVATKNFGAVLIQYLNERYGQTLKILRYMENDPYENLFNADVIVTTIFSGGTAVDIPNLTTVFMTVSIDSPVANAQTLGRLREIPGRDVNFIYFYSSDIPKHVNNHYRRKNLFADRILTYKELRNSFYL